MRVPKLLTGMWLLALAAGSAAITFGSLVYFDADELPPFVIEKLPLPMEDLWLFALKAHVIAAAFALPACILLSLKVMLRVPRVHRWLGRVTGTVVLFVLAPSGFYLSVFAKGGAPATAGFMLSGAIVAIAMVRAVISARDGDYAQHRRFTMHVLAQMAVAVVSRAMLFALDAAGADADAAYLFSLWAPVLGGAGLVELLVSRPTRRNHHVAVSRPADAHPREPRLSAAA